MRPLFEQIMAQHTEKQVVSLCKKCIKKLSFKSGADVRNLSDLCFWMFILGDHGLVFQLAALTHDLPFDRHFAVWELIHEMWGLEVYLLRKSGDTQGAEARRNAIIANLRMPGEDTSQDEHDRRQAKRYNRVTYAEWTRQADIEMASVAGDEKRANGWRFIALQTMMGWGETGLYPDFAAHDERREAEIVLFADILAGRDAAPKPEPDPTIVVEKKLPKKFRDACTLILTDREAGVNALAVPAFDELTHQRDAVFAELAYFDGDFEKALGLDMSICPWWGEWHYSNIRTEHIAAMTFAAFRLGKEAGLITFFKEQIALEQTRTYGYKGTARGYEQQIEKLTAGYEAAVSAPRISSLLSLRVKDRSLEALKAYTAEGLWRVASFTQVRPMNLFNDVWLYPALTGQALREIAEAVKAG